MKNFRWIYGRQDTGYKVIKLFNCTWPIQFDAWILRYCEGDYIPPHTDPVEQGRHYRCNIVLWDADVGGVFVCNSTIYNSKRIKLFRSDINEHAVTKIEKGVRYVFSFGVVL